MMASHRFGRLLAPSRFVSGDETLSEGLSTSLSRMIQIALVLTLFARGWLTFFWDHPMRGLIWYEEWWEPVLQKYVSMSWAEFAMSSDSWISRLIKGCGLWLMLTSVLVGVMRHVAPHYLRWSLVPVMGFMALDVFARFMEHDERLGMGIEFSLQAVMPLLFFMMLGRSPRWHIVQNLALLATSLCFIGHGLFAVGYYPVPWEYQNMCMRFFRCGAEEAKLFLLVMGCLDFVAVVLLAVPRLRQLALGYMVVWGLATALARVLTHLEATQRWYGLDPWLLESLVRSSHWMVPLMLWCLFSRRDENVSMVR